jgi:predicted RNase H-like HicB family nuclease
MREYFAAICKISEGNFVVIFPDLPDCVAFADSLEIARDVASEALVDYFEEAKWTGESITEPSSYEAILSDPQNTGCEVIGLTVTRH